MEQIREETDHRLKLRLLSAALMIFVAQLDINLIINGFRISLAIIFLPVFAFLSKASPSFRSPPSPRPAFCWCAASLSGCTGETFCRPFGLTRRR